MKHGVKREFISVAPHLGRVSYGAAELRRVYIKHMSLAFFFSIIATSILLNSLRFLIDQDIFNPAPQHIVRIFKYSEIELPRPISDVEFGLSAYPFIEEQKIANPVDGSLPMLPIVKKSDAPNRSLPRERRSNKDLDGLPGPAGVDKLQSDDRTIKKNPFGNERAPADRDDIAGGSGESREPWRKGGIPVAGKSGEPPSGVDRSGVGSSSKPSAGTTAYGLGSGGEGEGEGGGGYSMKWLQGAMRRKISGDLLKYPAGADVSAQVKILAVVLPDGGVKSVKPVQKANRILEEAAMKTIRTWRFEPLAESMPQVEQSCVVTLFFKLK